MRPGVALVGMAALLLAMLGRMGALDWLPGVLFVAAMVGAVILFVVTLFAVGAAVLAVPVLAIIAVTEWAWPTPKPGGTAQELAPPPG